MYVSETGKENGMNNLNCSICEDAGGVLSSRGAHFLCEIRERNGEATPKMDTIVEDSVPRASGICGGTPAKGGTYFGPLAKKTEF